MIKVVVCDDLLPIRMHFAQIIDDEDDMQVVGMCDCGNKLLDAVKKVNPDVVLLDIQMESGEAGIEATKKIMEYNDNIKVVIITIHEEEDLIFKAYLAGAVDYILKTDSDDQIIKSIREVYDNQVFVRPYVARKIIDEFSRMQKHQSSILFIISIMSKLTKTELEIMRMLYDDIPRVKIAEVRCVELTTINTQIRNLLNKLSYHSVREMCKNLKMLQIFDVFPLDEIINKNK